jgi:uncharacterized protein
MRALLDVNVLIALLDADHSLHSRATQWFAKQVKHGWASCPITQNGCMRIMSHPSYPHPLPVSAVSARLAEASASQFHAFWADDISLIDAEIFDCARIHGPGQITDIYLLGLAIGHGGQFVTFDTSISLNAIRRAEKKHVLTL